MTLIGPLSRKYSARLNLQVVKNLNLFGDTKVTAVSYQARKGSNRFHILIMYTKMNKVPIQCHLASYYQAPRCAYSATALTPAVPSLVTKVRNDLKTAMKTKDGAR